MELKTTPYESIRFAHAMLPDAIFLLTDGQFNDKTERFLKQNNHYQDPFEGTQVKVPVHTIGFFFQEGEVLLKRIAAENGGTYRFVPPPEGKKKKKK